MSVPDVGDVATPALLRAARVAYGHAIRHELAQRGIDDLPRNGAFVIGGIGNRGLALHALIPQLGVSKQAASQLVDALVVRGYLARTSDPDDRRRMNVSLTERGEAAAEAVRAGVESVDDELAERLGAEGVQQLRTGLVALCEIRDRMESGAEGRGVAD